MKVRKFWEANFLMLELTLSVIISFLFAIWSEFIDKSVFINHILTDGREVLYNALVTLFGSLLGFVIAAAAIVLGYASNEKLAIVRKSKHYQDLWEVFQSAMRVLAAATLLSLIGLIFDKDKNPVNLILYVNMFFSVLAFFRIGRTVWILEYIIAIIAKPLNKHTAK